MIRLTDMPKYGLYKDSGIEWLGNIPSSWPILKLKMIVKEHSGNGFPIELQGQEGKIPFLKVSDISGSGTYIESAANNVSMSVVNRNKWNIIPAGSLVTAKIGEALRKNHRKITKEPSLIDNNCIAFECKHVNVKFNYYLHLVLDFEWFVNPGAVPSISVKKYKNEKVAIPSLEEQISIASFLDKKTSLIDEAINTKKQQISLLSERKQIMIQQAITQGLDPTVPMKDSGVAWIGQIPAHWEVRRSKFVFCQRKERARADDVQLSATQAYGVIPQEQYEEMIGRKVVKISFHLEKRKHVEIDDFVISMRSFQGGLERAWASGCIRSSYVVLRPVNKNEIDAGFFSYMLKLPTYINALQMTASFIRDGQDLNFDNFAQVDLFIPPIEEQKAIFSAIQTKVDEINKSIVLLMEQITKYQEYKTILINSAVTGKIKVV